jgi:hypothetical protein
MRTGGCQCGAVRYESEGEPLALYFCHCRECRRQSASAFGISLIVPRKGLRVTQGAPKFWTRPPTAVVGLNAPSARTAARGSGMSPRAGRRLSASRVDRWTTLPMSPPRSISGHRENYRAWTYQTASSNFCRSRNDCHSPPVSSGRDQTRASGTRPIHVWSQG